MNDLTIRPDLEVRGQIMGLEARMRAYNESNGLAEPVCPLKHVFAPGVYVREIFIPAGTLVVGKIHKHAHPNILVQGHVMVSTEEGPVEYHAPLTMVSAAGTKRVVYAVTDTIWVTIHLTNETDLEKIEAEIIAPDYAEYEASQGIVEGEVVRCLGLP